MKVVSLIVALALALTPGAPAQTAPLGRVGEAVVSAAQPSAGTVEATQSNDDSPAPGPSTYLLLALGLFGMGLVSRRRQAD